MSKKQENTELAVQEQTTAVATTSTREGFENVDVSEIAMPRTKLLQSNSPELSDRDYNFRAGDVIHGLTMEKLPEKFIPIMFLPDTNILFTPRDQAAKMSLKAKLNLSDEDVNSVILCRARDGKHGDKFGACEACKLNKFDGNEKPPCMNTINVLILPEGEDMPVVLQFSNTSRKHGVKFKSITYYQKGNLYDNVYKINPLSKNSGGKSWYEMEVKPAGKPSEEDLAKARELRQQFSNMVLVVDEGDDTPFAEPSTEF